MSYMKPKKYDIEPQQTLVAAEPPAEYGKADREHRRQDLPPNCMTVDEYFDELLGLIRQDYARIQGDC